MFESRFNSVERIMAYNQLAQEAPATIEATQCASSLRVTSSSVQYTHLFNTSTECSCPLKQPSERRVASASYSGRLADYCCRPEDNWPTEGALSYRGVWMRYRPELPAVLKVSGQRFCACMQWLLCFLAGVQCVLQP
jgi:hypothetical protein